MSGTFDPLTLPFDHCPSAISETNPKACCHQVERLRRVQLNVQLALLQCFKLFRRQVDRTRELSARGLCDREVADGCTARPWRYRRWSRATVAGAANPSNAPEIVSLRPASVAVAEPFPVTLGRSVGVVGTHPSRRIGRRALSSERGGKASAASVIATRARQRIIMYLWDAAYLTMLPPNDGQTRYSQVPALSRSPKACKPLRGSR